MIVSNGGGGPWDFFWQNLPLVLLRQQPLETLWHMHAQPPLWNALGAILVHLFGIRMMIVLHALNIGFGAGITVLSALLVDRITGRRGFAVATGVLVGLHPALLLFEAYGLYTVFVAFLVLLSAFLLAEAVRRDSPGRAVGFVAALSALALTRSVYHPVILLAAVPAAAACVSRTSRRYVVAMVVVALLPWGWYAKNEIQYGFFGGSSWYGMGLWRVVELDQDVGRMNVLLREGKLSPVVTKPPFAPPSEYVALGFDRTSPIPSLARDDLHNINIPAISRAYAKSAVAAIEAYPLHYLRNVLHAYVRFTSPSTTYLQALPNRARILPLARAYETLLGRPGVKLSKADDAGAGGSLYLILIPSVLLAGLLGIGSRLRRSGLGLGPLRREAVELYLILIVAYTTVVGCTMEYGENTRFKFLIEPALVVLTMALVARWSPGAPSQSSASENGTS